MSRATLVTRQSLPLMIATTVFAGGIGISITAYMILRHRENSELQAWFAQASTARRQEIEDAFRSPMLSTFRLSRRLAPLDESTSLSERFANLIRPGLESIPGVLAAAWISRVETERRQQHEESTRRDGFANYQIRPAAGDAANLPEIAGTDLFPIHYVEPLEPNRSVQGLDFRSIPEAAEAMSRSLALGRMALSKPFRWRTSRGEHTAIMGVRPIRSGRSRDDTEADPVDNVVAFFVVIHALDTTILQQMGTSGRQPETGDFEEPAQTAPGEQDASPAPAGQSNQVLALELLNEFPRDPVDVLLSFKDAAGVPQPIALYDASEHRVLEDELDAAQLRNSDRPEIPIELDGLAEGWVLNCVATPTLVSAYTTWQPLAVLAFGIVLTFGLTIYSRLVLARQQEFKELMDREGYLLHALMDNIPDAVYFKDRQSRFIRISRAQADKFGFDSPEKAIGKTDAEIFTEEHAQSALEDERKIMRTGQPMVAQLEKETWSDREDTWVSSTKMPLYDQSGDVVGTFGISRDVTELKRTQDQLLEARDAANAANQAKSNFLAVMSHEIRTPMNAIIGMTELLLDTELDSTQRDYLTIVSESAESLLSLINQILDFSKIEAGKLELESVDFSLREEIGGTLKSLGLRAHGKDLELAWHVDPETPDSLRGDPGRLRQILVNLVGNSIKFTHDGEIVVDVQLQEQQDSAALLHFVVRDTGIGIPAEKHDVVFSAFEQADSSTTRQFGGTGLGLAIAQRIVDAMQGQIWLESTPGQGSRFHFTARFALGKPKAPEELPELGDLSVLVVDDNATNRRILKEILESWEISVALVESAQDALATLRNHVERGEALPLLVSDVNMPHMDGFELIEHIRADDALRETAVIVLTSGGRQGDVVRCEELGVSDHLMKPVRQSELLESLARAVGRRPESRRPELAVAESGDDVELPPLKILLAEDGLANQKMAVGLLSKWGHDVTVAENGEQAVSLWQSGKFDVVLMDVQMPVVDGLDATRRIRELEERQQSDERIPIIAMTARAMKGDREMCLNAGMDDYVSKPVRRNELYSCLAKLRLPSKVDDRSQA